MHPLRQLSDDERATFWAWTKGLFAFYGAVVLALALVVGTESMPVPKRLSAALDHVATARLDGALQYARAVRAVHNRADGPLTEARHP